MLSLICVPRFRDAMAGAHVWPGRNLSGRFDIRVVLRSDALADSYIFSLPVDGVNDAANPFSFFSSCEPFPRCPVERSLLGLEILEERTERREAGMLSLALDALLSPDPGVPRSVVALSASCDALHGTFIFWQGLCLLLGALVNFGALIGLRTDLSVDRFRLWLFAFEGLFRPGALVVV